jgi:hypothetical protein
VVNVSSPGTPGLRPQAVDKLRPARPRPPPSIAPARSAGCRCWSRSPRPRRRRHRRRRQITALDLGLDGIIATNTTIARTGLVAAGEVAALGATAVGRATQARALAVLPPARAPAPALADRRRRSRTPTAPGPHRAGATWSGLHRFRLAGPVGAASATACRGTLTASGSPLAEAVGSDAP